MDISTHTKKLLAGTAAVVLTVSAAGAAIAVNLGTADPAAGSPAGQLSATEPIVSQTPAAATPSTIYVDEVVTIPATAAPANSSSPTPTVRSSPSGTPASPSYGDDHSDDRDDHAESDDHDDDGHEVESHDGADDDD